MGSPVKFELVVNAKLAEEFQQIKQEFEANAQEACEYEEHFAFTVVPSEDNVLVDQVTYDGYSCLENDYNVIGQSRSGIYLCRFSDVALNHFEMKQQQQQKKQSSSSTPTPKTCRMIIFKVMHGKQTLALVRKDNKLPSICATPHFNSHMSVIPPKPKDSTETKFDHAQLYLYELMGVENKITTNTYAARKRPRHCMPYAIVTWSQH